MECSICDLRSSVGFCAECQALLCEVCGTACGKCKKPICPEHVHETRGGRTLCQVCYEEYQKQHEDEGSAIHPGVGPGGAPEEEEEERVLVASVREPPPPWQLSLYMAFAGIALMALIVLIPGFRQFPLPGGESFPTPYILLILPAFAALWAVVGLLGQSHQEKRLQCLLSLGVVLVTCVLAYWAVRTDPARLAEQEAEQQRINRDNMTQEQLEQRLLQKLRQFGPK